MKNKTLAIFGIGTYILSVISSAEDLEGNLTMPAILIAISGLATIVFVVMATIRLWQIQRSISVLLIASEAILIMFTMILEFTSPTYGSPIIILLNITRVVHLVVFIWATILLWKITKKPDKQKNVVANIS